MFGTCLRMMRRTRYDLVHAVEESAFIAVAMKQLTGVPYVYDMDSSLAEQMVEAFPILRFVFPGLRRFEAAAVRRSVGVLTVCAALEDVAHGHAPGTPVGRVEDTTLLSPRGKSNGSPAPARDRRGARSPCTWETWSTIRESTCCWKDSVTHWIACPRRGS